MTPQSKKAKGRKLQQEVRKKILKAFPELKPDDVRSTSMGNQGVDVQLSPFAKQWFPFSVECKSHKEFAVYKFFDQITPEADLFPLVVVKANGREPLVILNIDNFFSLIGAELNA